MAVELQSKEPEFHPFTPAERDIFNCRLLMAGHNEAEVTPIVEVMQNTAWPRFQDYLSESQQNNLQSVMRLKELADLCLYVYYPKNRINLRYRIAGGLFNKAVEAIMADYTPSPNGKA